MTDTPLSPGARELRDIDRWLQTLPGVREKRLTLRALFELQAAALCAAHRARLPFAAHILAGQRRDAAAIFAAELGREQAELALARWHGFKDRAALLARADDEVDPGFEAACDAIVSGDAAALRTLLAQRPALATARSAFAHRSTLLHYVAANGVEAHRQWQSPKNAVEIAELLLAAGADPNAVCPCYGPADSVMGLLLSSAHPAQAGVQADLVELLCKAGVALDGEDGGGSLLWQALVWGYTAAADRLAAIGARRDNLVFAAGLGDLAAVQGYFDERGVKAGSVPSGPIAGRGSPSLAEHPLELALIYASAHGRRTVVEFLLAHGPDLTVKEPVWGATAPGMAQYYQRSELIPLFAARAGSG